MIGNYGKYNKNNNRNQFILSIKSPLKSSIINTNKRSNDSHDYDKERTKSEEIELTVCIYIRQYINTATYGGSV